MDVLDVTFCGVIVRDILGDTVVVVVVVVVEKFVDRSGNFFGSKGLIPSDPVVSVFLVSRLDSDESVSNLCDGIVLPA